MYISVKNKTSHKSTEEWNEMELKAKNILI